MKTLKLAVIALALTVASGCGDITVGSAIADFCDAKPEMRADHATRYRHSEHPTTCSRDMTLPRMDNVLIVVDDVDDVVARLRSHGAELVGEIARYEDIYRLCFVRGTEGIMIGLAEQLR
jgi:hypothetical protein